MFWRFILRPDVGPLVSLFAATLSILFFALNFWFSRRMASRSLYLEAHKMLFDIDRQMIAEPRLWAFYDDHPIRFDPAFDGSSVHLRAKLEAFAYLQLNMFEIVLVEVPKLTFRGKRSQSKVWHEFFYDTLSRSSLLCSILERPGIAKIYNAVLLKRYDEWKTKKAEAASAKSAPSR